MRNLSVSRLMVWSLGLAGLLSAGAPAAKAEFFEYSTVFTVSPVGTTPAIPPASITNASPNSTFNTGSGNSVTLLGDASNNNPPHQSALGNGTDIVFGDISAVAGSLGSPTANQAVQFDYSAVITITDYPSFLAVNPTGTGTVTLNGRITGTIGGFQVDLNNLVFAPNPKTVTIAGTTYTVDFNSYTAPGLKTNGAFGAHVTAAVPEPASVAMLGLGGLGALGLFRRSRKAKPTA